MPEPLSWPVASVPRREAERDSRAVERPAPFRTPAFPVVAPPSSAWLFRGYRPGLTTLWAAASARWMNRSFAPARVDQMRRTYRDCASAEPPAVSPENEDRPDAGQPAEAGSKAAVEPAGSGASDRLF